MYRKPSRKATRKVLKLFNYKYDYNYLPLKKINYDYEYNYSIKKENQLQLQLRNDYLIDYFCYFLLLLCLHFSLLINSDI